MDSKTITRLIDLNRQFYQTFAVQFSATRQRLQPGVLRLLNMLPPGCRLLDLGCGTGELARRLHRDGFSGTYLGVDFSPPLLEAGQVGSLPANFSFLPLDLSTPGWEQSVTRNLSDQPGDGKERAFDIITAFAVLHHIPGQTTRSRIVQGVWSLLAPGGLFLNSNWQFLNSPRLSDRIQPWSAAGLSAQEVDPGDYLLDWRSGGSALRYIHHFSEDELRALAQDSGFEVIDAYLSDGENGRLGLYQVWKKE